MKTNKRTSGKIKHKSNTELEERHITTGQVNKYILCLARDSANNIYSGTQRDGVFKWNANSESWSDVNSGIPVGSRFIHALKVDRTARSGNILYAGTQAHGIYVSPNGGGSWEALNTGLSTQEGFILSLRIRASGTVYAGTQVYGVFERSRNGNAWRAKNTGLPRPIGEAPNYRAYTILCLLKDSSEKIYAGTQGAGIFKWNTDRRTWEAKNTGLPQPVGEAPNYKAFHILSMGKDSLGSVYAGTQGAGVFKWNGSRWSAINSGLPQPAGEAPNYRAFHILGLVADAENNVYAGTQGAGIFRRRPNESRWSAINTGLPRPGGEAPNYKAFHITCLENDSVNNIYAGTQGAGVFKLANGDNSWSAVN